MQVSSDLSLVDLDVPFSFVFSLGAIFNAYSNLGVLVVITWQVLFVSVPMIVLAIWLQVIGMILFLMAKLHVYVSVPMIFLHSLFSLTETCYVWSCRGTI
jgi:hypothetical protein